MEGHAPDKRSNGYIKPMQLTQDKLMHRSGQIFALLAMVASAPAQQRLPLRMQLLQRSFSSWKAVENSNNPALAALLAPDYLYVGSEGALSPSQLGVALKDCRLLEFNLAKPRLLSLDANAATLAYTADQDFRCHGMQQPAHLNVVDVFRKQNGTWRIVCHFEVAASERKVAR